MTTIEQQHLKGFTLKNLIITIVSTASVVASCLTATFAIKADIQDIKSSVEINNRVTDLRLRTLETEVNILQADVEKLKEVKK